MLWQMTSVLDLQIVNHCFAYMTFIHFISYKLSQLFCCDVVSNLVAGRVGLVQAVESYRL